MRKHLIFLFIFVAFHTVYGQGSRTIKQAVPSLSEAVTRFRELDARRKTIRENLKNAEVRTIRSVLREGPKDEFETDNDYLNRVKDNDRKRAEITGKYFLLETDTLKDITGELEYLKGLRFSGTSVQLALGSYDIEARRFNRVVLSVSYVMNERMAGKRAAKKGKMEEVDHQIDAVAVLELPPDQARVLRENESELLVEPPLCINASGNIDFVREIVVSVRGSDVSGMIKDCHTAYYISEVTGMKLVYIPGGTFRMGSTAGDDDEKPVHEVVIPKGFFMGESEVTQAEWRAVMGSNPSFYRGENRPVDNVTYEMALQFVKKLNELEKTSAYRLPTEAEWEYAARAGKTTEWTFGSQESYIGSYAWYFENANRQTHEVAQKAPNNWGLYDIHGNVWEWVSDWYAPDYYKKSERVNPVGPAKGDYRILRGGSWNGRPTYSRSANRYPNYPAVPDKEFGLRIIRME